MNGWTSAALYMLIVCLAAFFWKLTADWGMNPTVFITYGMIFGGFSLLAFAQPGPLAIETFRHINTWLYGLIFFISGIPFIYVLKYIDISTTHILMTLHLVVTTVLLTVFVKRPKRLGQRALCSVFVLAGVGVMMTQIPKNVVFSSLLCIGLMVLLRSFRALTVQLHTPNNKARNFEQEIRITGVVMAVTGLCAYFLLAAGTSLQSLAPTPTGLENFLPTWAQFFHLNTLLLAGSYGVLCFGSMRYLEFHAIKHLGSISFLALMSFLPVLSLGLEILADMIHLVPLRMPSLTIYHFLSFVLIVLGSLGFLYLDKTKQARQKDSAQMQRDAMIAAHAVQFTEGNKAKAAKMLGISQAVLHVALHEKNSHKALPEKISQKMHNHFTENVSIRDALTGLYNKSQFECLAHDILQADKMVSLLYLDLNHFKPVNDTYGHEMGDVVLKKIAERLEKNVDKNSIVARLSGDEFAVLLTPVHEKNAESIRERLQACMAKPISLPTGQTITVGASIGLASSPDDGNTIKTLLSKADKRMYHNKNTSR